MQQRRGSLASSAGNGSAAASGFEVDAGRELNGNVILLRGSKVPPTNGEVGGSHILLRADTSNKAGGGGGGSGPAGLVAADGRNGGSVGQILIRRHRTGELNEGLLLHSVKRLGGGAPILLLKSNDNGNGHILIQTSSATTAGLEDGIDGNGGAGRRGASQDDIFRRADRFQVSVTDVSPEEDSLTAKASSLPLGVDGEPIKLPENLESLPRADHFPTQRHRWNTNEEIAAILISFDRHSQWQSKEVKIRPKSGSMLLYSRKKVRYRRDGYCWKKRKDGKTTREDHMKLKVQGTECIYGCYVHSAILPTFHRRCYWLLQNPDIVLVHYLNVPYPDDNKLAVIAPSLSLWADKKEWTKDELVSQLKPMFFGEDESDPDGGGEPDASTAETVEAIVAQLMEKQRAARQAALVKRLECGCPDSTCADGKSCSHPARRIGAAKGETAAPPSVDVANSASSSDTRPHGVVGDGDQVSSTTGSGALYLATAAAAAADRASGVYAAASRQTQPRHHRSHAMAQQQQQHHHQHQTRHQRQMEVQGVQRRSAGAGGAAGTPPLVLSLSQLRSAGGGGFLILNGNAADGSSGGSTTGPFVAPVSVADFVAGAVARPEPDAPLEGAPATLLDRDQLDSSHFRPNGILVGASAALDSDVSRPGSSSSSLATPSPSTRQTFVRRADGVFRASTRRDEDSSERVDEAVDFGRRVFCTDAVTVLGASVDSSAANSSLDGSLVGGVFFDETLQLSHEDIQKTLSANLPLCSPDLRSTRRNHEEITPSVGVDRVDLHRRVQRVSHAPHDVVDPMDFADGCDAVASPTHVVDDDVFVNLDAFDMLGEFPDLEALDSGPTGLLDVVEAVEIDDSATISGKGRPGPCDDTRNDTSVVRITDYSPEWAYPEGGVKVLVTGPWHSSAPYAVLFDAFPVPTTLVQDGVLRCYCPAHEVGLASLQVACDGRVVSDSVAFEYKPLPREERSLAPEPEVERSDDDLLKFTLLRRLEAMDDRLQIKREPGEGVDCVEDTALFTRPDFEDRLVTYCRTLTARPWKCGEEPSASWFSRHRGMTLLHLAASLGYSRLVCALLHWRAENSSLLLETEVDALGRDEDGCTPLMWACQRGHAETAVMLYKWNHAALDVRNYASQTALECARHNRNNDLVRELEKLEARRDRANVLLRHAAYSDGISSPVVVSPASSIASLTSVASTGRSRDGVFLRPGLVYRSESQRYKTTTVSGCDEDAPRSSHGRLIKRPSVDSGINMGCGGNGRYGGGSDAPPSSKTRSGKCHASARKQSRFDRSMSLPLSYPLLGREEMDPLDGFRSRKMDFALCEVGGGPRSDSPLIDVEAVSDDESDTRNSVVGEQDARVLTLAEQIIAAMPDRIKNESEEMMPDYSPGSTDITLSGDDGLSDVFMEPLLDRCTPGFEAAEFNFEYSDHNYRYYDVSTPCSSLSPASSGCLPSPRSFTLDSPSPPPTTADFCEFFQASGSVFEKDFSNLTLSDREQRELYEAAKIIQKAYRSYKGRQQQEQDKERTAAIVIQNYYRRYKQYAYFKQMTRAATVIQNGFRSYCEHKRFKKSQERTSGNVPNYFRNYAEQSVNAKGSREGTPASGLKRTYSQRRQHQAARKIQQFMRQSKNKLQKERAEKERREDRSADVPRKSPSPEGNSIASRNNGGGGDGTEKTRQADRNNWNSK